MKLKDLETVFNSVIDNLSEKEDNFEDLALNALTELNFTPEQVIGLWNEVLTHDVNLFPKQTYPIGVFGHPSFTLFEKKEYKMEIYRWPISNISIHSHHFSGAFKVLGTKTTHVQYNFIEQEKVCEGISIGDLNIRSNKTLNLNDTCKIEKYDKFIHSIKHNSDGGMTLLIRSKNDLDKYLSIFYYPGLKIELNMKLLLILEKKMEVFKYESNKMGFLDFLKTLSERELILCKIKNLIPAANEDEFNQYFEAKSIHASYISEALKKTRLMMVKLHLVNS
jgi:hypothetical protein